MRLKYKKIILGITMSTMFIGFVTFSLLTPSIGSSANEKKNQANVATEEPVTDKAQAVSSVDPSTDTTQVVASEVTGLEVDAYPEVNELVKKYFDSSVACDMDTLASLVTNIKHVNEKMLRAKYEFIEGYQNIQCYTLDGPSKGTFRVYVCSDLKLSNIDTLAPGLTCLYIITNQEGKLQVSLDELTEEEQLFMDKADDSDAVQKLSTTINTKFEEAITKDADLKAFWEKLESASTEQKATPEPAK